MRGEPRVTPLRSASQLFHQSAVPPTSSQAIRCESCGATLTPGQTECEYCGSQHNLPAYRSEASPKPNASPTAFRAKRFAVLLAVAATAAAAVWLVMR